MPLHYRFLDHTSKVKSRGSDRIYNKCVYSEVFVGTRQHTVLLGNENKYTISKDNHF